MARALECLAVMLTSIRSLASTALVLLASLTGACNDDPPAPSEVRTRITDDLGNVLREAEAASQGAEALPGDAAFDMIDRVLQSGGSSGAFLPRALSKLGLVGPRSDERSRGERELAGPPTNNDDEIDAVIRELNERLFTDANHQGDGIYTVPAELVCRTETFHDDGSTTETIDADCAQSLANAQLRIRTFLQAEGEPDEALQLALQIGANHDEPLVISLTHTSVAVTLDLDDAGRSMTALAPLFGEELPNTSLAGQLTGKLELFGPASAGWSLTIDRAVAIKVADPGVDLESPEAFRFTSAKATVAALSLDGVGKTGSLVIGLGETTVHVPDEQTFDLDLPGLTAVAMFMADKPIYLTHLGLGDRSTTVSINGSRAIAVDLNPADGRAFAATIARDALTGLETLTVTPKLDLRYSIDHSVLGDEPPIYDVTQVLLDGSLRGGERDRIEVLTGTFGITTNPASYGFAATAGQCVAPTYSEDVTTGAFYEQWSVAACD